MVHTHGVEGSTPPLATLDEYPSYGILAQLGEHLPYKQRVIGSSPIGPIFMFEMKENVFMRMHRGVFLCFGIICIYGTLTKNERIAMME